MARAPACARRASPVYGSTVSAAAVVAVPSAVVIVIFPVTARAGTVNVTSVGDEATTTAATVPTFTIGSTPPVWRFVPFTTTALSRDATGGVKPVILGSSLKIAVLVVVPI